MHQLHMKMRYSVEPRDRIYVKGYGFLYFWILWIFILWNLWQYYKDVPAANNGDIADFNGANATDSFSFKAKITGQTNDGRETDNVEIMVLLKYLSNFWRTIEMPLINCEVNLILNWSASCLIVNTNVANQNATFRITEAKLYVPVVTLWTQDNAKLLTQLKSVLKEQLIGTNIYQNQNY